MLRWSRVFLVALLLLAGGSIWSPAAKEAAGDQQLAHDNNVLYLHGLDGDDTDETTWNHAEVNDGDPSLTATGNVTSGTVTLEFDQNPSNSRDLALDDAVDLEVKFDLSFSGGSPQVSITLRVGGTSFQDQATSQNGSYEFVFDHDIQDLYAPDSVDLDVSFQLGIGVSYDFTMGSPSHIILPLLEQNEPPLPPTSISPDTTTDRTPDISWSGASDPNGDPLTYEIQIGTSSNGDEIFSWTSSQSAQTFHVGSALDPATYYVQVRSRDAEFASTPRQEQMVIESSPNQAPDAPTAIDPDESVDTTPMITWTGQDDPDGDALTFWIQIGNFSGTGDVVEWTETTGAQYTVQIDLAISTYYVQVRSYDGQYNSSILEETLEILEPGNAIPSIEITSISVTDEDLVVRGTASDDNSTIETVEVKLDGGAWQIVTGNPFVWSHRFPIDDIEEGWHSIRARAYDGELWSDEVVEEEFVEFEPEETNDDNETSDRGLFSNPAVVSGGIGGALLLLLILFFVFRPRPPPPEPVQEPEPEEEDPRVLDDDGMDEPVEEIVAEVVEEREDPEDDELEEEELVSPFWKG